MHELIIIGAGPAGLTAALYAGRARLETLVLEKMAVGGRILLSETIENFPGFPGGIATSELISRMEKQVRELNVKIESGEVLGLDARTKTVKTSSGEFTAKAIIIATGAIPRKLNIPGEERLTGRGVSYCATCDGPLYKEKMVVIVGGGNAVAEEALFLSRFAKKVVIIHRRDQLRASAILQEELKENKKISFLLQNVITEIHGATRVESLKTKNVLTGVEQNIACDGVFVYIGYDPDTAFLKGVVNLDENGFIIVNQDLQTSQAGIFACGDCLKKNLYQVITACSDGAVALEAAYKYIAAKGK